MPTRPAGPRVQGDNVGVLRLLTPGLLGTVCCFAAPLAGAPVIAWDLVDSRPHDASAYTQGLVAHAGVLIESTGDCCDPKRAESSVRRLDARTGRVLARRTIRAPIFAEGITVLRGSAWQLTWKDRVAYRVNPRTLRQVARRPYPFQGWGVTTDGRRLIASDGTARLRWLDAPRLRVRRSVVVRDGARAVRRLNELEWIRGVIWANVWRDDRIALIAPRTGRVRAWLDMSSLRARIGEGGEVLNGIARDPVTGHVIITGKNWDRMFVIRLRQRIPA